jgi:nucleolar MIF4G domain-containing protein 1
MNTDLRRAIFCIIVGSEDFLDAFEKLVKLELKNKQDRDIVTVLLHCCMQVTKCFVNLSKKTNTFTKLEDQFSFPFVLGEEI